MVDARHGALVSCYPTTSPEPRLGTERCDARRPSRPPVPHCATDTTLNNGPRSHQVAACASRDVRARRATRNELPPSIRMLYVPGAPRIIGVAGPCLSQRRTQSHGTHHTHPGTQWKSWTRWKIKAPTPRRGGGTHGTSGSGTLRKGEQPPLGEGLHQRLVNL